MSGSNLVNSALSYRSMEIGFEFVLGGIFRPGTPSVLGLYFISQR